MLISCYVDVVLVFRSIVVCVFTLFLFLFWEVIACECHVVSDT